MAFVVIFNARTCQLCSSIYIFEHVFDIRWLRLCPPIFISLCSAKRIHAKVYSKNCFTSTRWLKNLSASTSQYSIVMIVKPSGQLCGDVLIVGLLIEIGFAHSSFLSFVFTKIQMCDLTRTISPCNRKACKSNRVCQCVNKSNKSVHIFILKPKINMPESQFSFVLVSNLSSMLFISF